MNKVCFELTNGKKFFVDVYEEYAPITAANFMHLVDIGFYENTIFHRVVPGFMAQGGGYEIVDNVVTEKLIEYTIPGEFSSNGFVNNLKHLTGVVSMARTSDKNSASSQFFICDSVCEFLDGEFAAFGQVSDEESFNVIHEICTFTTGTIGEGFEDFPVVDSQEYTIKSAYRVEE